MKYFLLLFLIASCLPGRNIRPEVGECVLGQGMSVWKLLRMEQGKYLFASFPADRDARINVVDVGVPLKVIACPGQRRIDDIKRDITS